MALYFTFAIECYHEVDAIRIGERLRPLVLCTGIHRIPMADVHTFERGDLWYLTVCPKGPGYSLFGYGEGLNDPEVISTIIEQFYLEVSKEHGIRRALCGHEAHGAFENGDGSPGPDRFDIPDLIYDRDASAPANGTQEFGSRFHRNPTMYFAPSVET